jgi:type II secretory ATPase GspE/PulE/Tfp pilus assembly ATPase PilB-like protein
MNFSDLSSLVSKKAKPVSVVAPRRISTVRTDTHALALDRELAKGHASVIEVVELLIKHAQQSRASDVHLDPHANGLSVRLRVDGILQKTHEFPRVIQNEVMSRIKILCGLRTDEHFAAQDGRFRAVLSTDESVDVRVSIVPTYYGENCVMRLLSGESQEFTLESLGFTPANCEKIMRAVTKPYGMILATGPTGSGKTTTLYTLVKMLNVPGISIITVEDPVEYSISGINQIGINPRTNLTFPNALRSMLRQDPNVIMVGEIRDMETAGLAVNTALTGHLVLSTLHTNDAPTTLPRLLDMKVEPYLISSTVNVAIGQRLIRRVCNGCKQEKTITDIEATSLSEVIPDEMIENNRTFYHGAGCDKCKNTGYRGRAGLHEVMEIDATLREAILRKASANEIREVAIAQGMTTMLVDGFHKAAEGITTIEEVLRMRHE